MKTFLHSVLQEKGLVALDLGVHEAQSVDYPDFALLLAQALETGRASRGILVCGSGIGMSIAANRFPYIRAALVHDAYGARMCRQHNDANVLVLGERTTGIDVAKDCVEIFLNTPFEGGRHARRVDKLTELGPKP